MSVIKLTIVRDTKTLANLSVEIQKTLPHLIRSIRSLLGYNRERTAGKMASIAGIREFYIFHLNDPGPVKGLIFIERLRNAVAFLNHDDRQVAVLTKLKKHIFS